MKLDSGNIIILSTLVYLSIHTILATDAVSDPRVVSIREDRGSLYRDGEEVVLADLKRMIRSGEFIRLDVEIGKAASEEGSKFLEEITKFCEAQDFELALIHKESVYIPNRLKDEKIPLFGMNVDDPTIEMPSRFSHRSKVNIAWNGDSYEIFSLDDEVGEGSEIIAIKIDEGAWTLKFYAHLPKRVKKIYLEENERATIFVKGEDDSILATISLR